MICNIAIKSAAETEDEDDDKDDFAPRFFGGRRSDGEFSGIAPPPRQTVHLRSLSTNVKVETLVQKLDHFDENNTITWKQVRQKACDILLWNSACEEIMLFFSKCRDIS
jgi:hypothetical protein